MKPVPNPKVAAAAADTGVAAVRDPEEDAAVARVGAAAGATNRISPCFAHYP